MQFFSAKVFNLFTIALSILFFLSVVVATVSSIQEENRIALEFEQMMSDIADFNYNHSLEDSSTVNIEEGDTEAMFDNGTDAFIHAYYNYINAPTYHVISKSNTTNSIIGIDIKTQSQNTMIKFEDGSALYELITYEEGNTYGRTDSKKIFYDATSNLVYLRETRDIRKSGEDFVAVYSKPWEYAGIEFFLNEAGFMPGESVYDFSKKAVIEETYYKEVKVNGVIKEYQTQIISNATLAGKPFAKVAKYLANAVELPVITQMKENLIINADGTIKALFLDDKFEVKTKVGPTVMTVKCASQSTYYFMNIGKEPLAVEKPDVSNAVAR